MKIGLYGGTFDPVHCGHLIIAQYVKDELSLDKIYFIPASAPPHKTFKAEPSLRYQMLQLAIAGNPGFAISDFEMTSSSVSYSVDTVAHFKNQFNLSRDGLFFIIGSDSFVDFPKWREPDQIVQLCQIVVFPRNRNDWSRAANRFKKQVIYLRSAPLIEISSTHIRTFVQQGRSIKYLVPDAVENFIASTKLYR